MNKYICTWLCEDQKGEESFFPQTGLSSSTISHQLIYWRCVITFFITSTKYNQSEKHILFTNARKFPSIQGKGVEEILNELGVQIIQTDFKYKTPKGYYKAWQNQFYEFSILEHIASNFSNDSDLFLIVDSDCLFIKPAQPMFERAAAEGGFISYEMGYPENYEINGISRAEMKEIYESILGEKIEIIPPYHAGEFFLSSVAIAKKLFADFETLWPQLLERNARGQKKFNEEAHTLSFLYFRNGLVPGKANGFIKRIWTNPVFYRNVEKSDAELTIWHLPAEKTYRIPKLLSLLFAKENFGLDLPTDQFTRLIKDTICIPDTSVISLSKYYVHTYTNALKKRLLKST